MITANEAKKPNRTPQEIADEHQVHVKTVIDLFIDEPGVIRFGHGPRPNKRQYYTLRIPPEVEQRVFDRLRVKGNRRHLTPS